MLDQDLAALYEVETKALVQAVQRNIGRFPPDFMFQLSFQEFTALRPQIVTSKGRGRTTHCSVRLYGTWRRDALERTPEQACRGDKHRDHKSVCQTSTTCRLKCRVDRPIGPSRAKL